MMKFYTYPLILLLSLTLFSCSTEYISDANSSLKVSNFAASISSNELVGEWKLSAMNSDTFVDLDRDGTGDKNLLNESSCFDGMKIIFTEETKADGTLARKFSTTNARLDFNGNNTGDFVCAADRVDSGTWDIEGAELILNISIDGTIYTQRKPLNYNTSTFAFPVSKAESNLYVKDPGSTSASKITILDLEYKRL